MKNMKWLKRTKAGSYIVEAVIVIPVFIMAVLMLISIIPITAVCENTAFAVADEMHIEMVKSAFRKNSGALPVLLRHRIVTENPKINFCGIKDFDYLYSDENIDDLLHLDMEIIFREKNPMGLFSSVNFQCKATARAFTGKYHSIPPCSSEDSDDDKIVYIFPEWGKRYHGKNCTYIKSNCRMVYLSQDTKKDFRPCQLCHAGSALIGSPVFCFMQNGRVYHIAGCRTIDKYYVETTKKECESRGYTPCSKCGGG